MRNDKILDRIFRNFDRLADEYIDLPETIEVENRFWNYMDEKYFANEKNKEKKNFEKIFYEVGLYKERQGFLYGFNYAIELLGKNTPL